MKRNKSDCKGYSVTNMGHFFMKIKKTQRVDPRTKMTEQKLQNQREKTRP